MLLVRTLLIIELLSPQIKWSKNGKLLKASRDFKPSFDGCTASLEIVEVYCEDEGTYECEAKNTAGEAKTSAVLTVTGRHFCRTSQRLYLWPLKCYGTLFAGNFTPTHLLVTLITLNRRLHLRNA